ncbi:MAG: TonB-dependent receptor [Bacteroidota bacterium]
MDKIFLTVLTIFFMNAGISAFAQPTADNNRQGVLYGRIVDAATGDELINATVFIVGTTLGSISDIEGNYRLANLPAGTYTVSYSMLGYAKTILNGVVIDGAEPKKIDVALKEEVLESEEVVVEAEMIKSTESALLKIRQRSASVSDGISTEAMSKTNVSTAADAVSQVTGASIVEGKYVYVRGLGDRYMYTQLNGVTLPSSDPDRNAVSLDIFPAKFIENIVTEKTFTPDKPGDFTGGNVNINTKSFPETFSFSMSAGTGYLFSTSLQKILSYRGGGTDWLGMDDGTRQIPSQLMSPGSVIPDIGYSYTNREKALALDQASKSFNGVMHPSASTALLNNSYSVSIGDQLSFGETVVGYIASSNYSRSFSSYKDGITAQYNLTGRVSEVNELNNLYKLNDTKGVDEVLWGVMGNISVKPSPFHSVQINYSRNQSGESVARYQVGEMPRDFAPGTYYETRTLKYVERTLESVQLRGSHLFTDFAGSKIEWNATSTLSLQDEPDLRFFSNDFTPNGDDTLYSISASNYPEPTRYFRNLNERLANYSIDYALPLRDLTGFNGTIKIGGLYSHKNRTFAERRYKYNWSSVQYNGDPDMFFSDAVGMSDTLTGFYDFGSYIVDASEAAGSYDGEQYVRAGYGMLDVDLIPGFRFVGGARHETTRMNVASKDTTKQRGNLSVDDLLPSANIIVSVADNMNIRAAYGRTLARPTLRELAPFANFDFVGDFIFIGNPDLERTLVNNYDLRWEWFTRPGEITAVSGFYKAFTNPIERAIVSNNNQGQFQNVAEATVYGIEFEVRKKLDQLWDPLTNVHIGANVTLIQSEVDIPSKEMLVVKQLDPNAGSKRGLQGQSPYVVNVDLGYDDFATKTNAAVTYNIFGKRLSEVSLGGSPNVYELPRASLDATFSRGIFEYFVLKVGLKNLLDAPVKKVQEYKGQEFIVVEHRYGRSISLGISYSL